MTREYILSTVLGNSSSRLGIVSKNDNHNIIILLFALKLFFYQSPKFTTSHDRGVDKYFHLWGGYIYIYSLFPKQIAG